MGAVVAVLVLSYAAVAFAPANSPIAIWWPAAGVAGALVVLSPRSRWPLLAGGLYLAASAGNLFAGRPLDTAAVFGMVTPLEALLLAVLVGAHRRRPRLDSLVDVLRLLAAAVMTAAAAGLLAAGMATALFDVDLGTGVRTLTASHAAALLVIVPAALLVAQQGRDAVGSVGRREITVQVLVTAAAFAIVYGKDQHAPVSYVVLPFLLWAALRFDPAVVALELVGAGTVITVLTRLGGGPFAPRSGVTAQYLGSLAQGFLVVCVACVLPLAVAMAQRQTVLSEIIAAGHDLQRARDFSDAVVNGSDSLMVVIDPHGEILSVNSAVERLTGHPSVTLVGRNFTSLLVPGFELASLRDFATVHAPGQLRELAWLGTDGAREVVCTAGRLPGGAESGFVITGIDATNQRRAERMLSSVLDATTNTVIIGVDPHGTITFFNTGAAAMLGYDPADVVGIADPGLFHDAEEIAARAAELGVVTGFEVFVHQVQTTGTPERRDWTYVRADGTRLTVSLNVSARRDAGGALVGYLGVAEDVTERRAAERALESALAQEREAVLAMQEVDRLKSAFVSSTSHELRTPLTSVLGFSQMLMSQSIGPVNERQLDMLGRIEKNGRRLLALVEDLLTLSRIESDELELAQDPVDLTEAVDAALDAVAELLRPRHLELRVDTHRVGPIMVLGDRDHLERAVINLLSNAVKFTEDGGVVELDLSRKDDVVVLRISDSGVGIPVREQASLFTRFFRASTATDAAIPGTGLGLSIVKAVIDAHHGTIDVESEPGRGTTFVVSLPIAA